MRLKYVNHDDIMQYSNLTWGAHKVGGIFQRSASSSPFYEKGRGELACISPVVGYIGICKLTSCEIEISDYIKIGEEICMIKKIPLCQVSETVR